MLALPKQDLLEHNQPMTIKQNIKLVFMNTQTFKQNKEIQLFSIPSRHQICTIHLEHNE